MPEGDYSRLLSSSAVLAAAGPLAWPRRSPWRRPGWQVTVLERAPAFGEAGAGLGLTVNGMTALAAIGLDGAVSAAGYQTPAAGLQDLAGRWLMRFRDQRGGNGRAARTAGR